MATRVRASQLAIYAAALMLTACTSSTSSGHPASSVASTGTPGQTVAPAPATSSVAPGSVAPGQTLGQCTTDCATGDDGMQYRVTLTRRFAGNGGTPVVAVGFTLTNLSSTGHDFDATGGGFSAVLSSGGGVQIENELSSTDAGDPHCYSNPLSNPGSTDPNVVHVDAGKTFAFPKQICMRVTPPDKVTEILFEDQDASTNATVVLPTPI